MKELGFNVIKLWAVWNTIEKTKSEFDFEDLDKLVDISAQNGLKVIINTIPEGAPYWTERENADSLYRTSKGEVLTYSGPANIPSAGWPGLCLDNEDAQEMVSRFIYETARHFADHPAVIAIDVWNEPHLEPMFDYTGQLLCYCGGSKDRFRQWLKERYGTLAELNKKWFRCYSDWSQVTPPPRFGTYADMIDWRRFWLSNLADWLKLRVTAARKGAPGKLIQTHTAFSAYMGARSHGGLGNELGDEFLLAKEVDVFGLSAFPLWLMGEAHVYRHLIHVEIIAEASGDKPFYQAELQGGAGKAGLLGGYVPSAEDVRLWNWNVIAGGGKGVVYWQYAAEPAGMESPGFGLIDSVGGDTPRLLSASKCAKDFNQEYLTNARRVPAVNGIYLSRSSDLLTYAAREEGKYTESFNGVYAMLYEAGIPVRFVHNDTLEKALSEGLEVLYLPMTFVLSDREQELLKDFAEKGGTLIMEPGTGMYAENGEMDMDYTFLHDLFGMEHAAIDALRPGKTVCKAGDGDGFACAYYRQIFSECAGDADVIAAFEDGAPAALKRKIGEGRAILLCGYAGAMYSEQCDGATREYISQFFDAKGYGAVESMENEGLLVRLLKDRDTHIIVAVNHGDADKTLHIKLRDADPISVMVPKKDGKIILA